MAPSKTRTGSKGKGKARDKPITMTTRQFDNGVAQHTLNFGRNSGYLYFKCGWHVHQFLIDGASQQPVPSTSSQHLPHITTRPPQASCCIVTVEEVDDEDTGPVTPPCHHVTFNTTLNPPSPNLPSDNDSHSTPSSPSHEDFTDKIFNTLPSPQTPRRNHGCGDYTPRTGHHSTRQTSGPAGNKKEHKATDIWPFFSKEGNKHQCNLCLYIFKFSSILIINCFLAALRNTLTQNAKAQALAPLLQPAHYNITCVLITSPTGSLAVTKKASKSWLKASKMLSRSITGIRVVIFQSQDSDIERHIRREPLSTPLLSLLFQMIK